MGIKDFQNFIENDETLSAAGVSTVDLVKAAWSLTGGHVRVVTIIIIALLVVTRNVLCPPGPGLWRQPRQLHAPGPLPHGRAQQSGSGGRR